MAFILACGEAATPVPTDAPPTAAPTAAPTATSAPAAATPTEAPSMPDADADLKAVADELAGKPGAIYIGDGDFSRLVGPAPGVSEKENEETGEMELDDPLGDGNGMVPLEFVEKNRHIFETDYYKSLIEKAKLTDPTPLTSRGEEIKVQYACINRALLPCKLQTIYFAENVRKRTAEQVDFEVSSYPELGLAGPDMMDLVEQGTIEFAQIQPAYVGGTWPLIDIIYIWGLWKDFKSEHEANTRLLPALDQGIYDNTGGGKLIYHIWYGGNDQYFFSTRGPTKEDFQGLKTRSHGTTMSDTIIALGGDAQMMAFAEVYTALERGILDAGVTGAHAGHGQRWYEIADNLIGPFISMPMGFETMNKDTWERIPADLQAIIIEEGAKMELENLRLAAVWNETGVKVNEEAGMIFIPFDDEMKQFVYEEVALGRVLPNWIKRIDEGSDREYAVDLWNEIVAPWAKVRIAVDGTITETE
jgi:TRAP-type C4-dicarboxylate transport system substrate-binding protein